MLIEKWFGCLLAVVNVWREIAEDGKVAPFSTWHAFWDVTPPKL